MKPGLVILFAFAAAILPSQTPTPSLPPESAQFDFWVGEWEVFTPDGRKAGDSRIEKIAAGWGLLENWQGVGGYVGKSLNAWAPETKQWQQFWIGIGGTLKLSGGLNEQGEMVLHGRTQRVDGKEAMERITWTPNADGTVRQHWQQSTDNGATWTTAFDGVYRMRRN